jgi:hypothetical protein
MCQLTPARSEFETALSRLCKRLTPQEVAAISALVDTDHNNFISLDEFLTFVRQKKGRGRAVLGAIVRGQVRRTCSHAREVPQAVLPPRRADCLAAGTPAHVPGDAFHL